MTDTLQAIRETYRNLDINSQESELLAQEELDAMAGDVDDTHADDANVPDSMPLPAALTVVETSHGDGFRFMQDIAEQMFAQFSAKAEDVKATQDSRTLHANMALGIKKLLIEWGAKVAEATERLEQSTPDERRKLGVNISHILEPEPQAESRPAAPPSAGVQANTKLAQAFFEKRS